ncbi:glutathione-regulated potassium-efflux system protein KefC [Bdellovibrio sp. 22V]|uniref:glutathione-regulated potassium-efflux system protein KefC n=1 Tax=Bdellovibrio TaxID=958 RepID=UPI002542C55E|nr:glutathione-regulated potassium-efflux system protein KefC [Bdellovibrio sp. 22V]WII71988.1 glutathione-regulated potassium-efflux system protein KefC [Bdellovibrio sp. 22V]
MHFNPLFYVLIFLTAALICVPISKRLGFGAVLGYLIAGMIVGPFGFGVIKSVEDLMHISEFGVVLLMFIIGLELEPKKLWEMRMAIFGMGTFQVLGSGLLIATGLYIFHPSSFATALLVGMAFSLSSTAMGLQLLGERRLLATTGGQSAFSILLFQDIAVIPMIAVLPLLATKVAAADSAVPAWLSVLKVIGVLAAVIVIGRLALRTLLRWIASQHLREIFTAFALFLVVGMSFLMQSLGMSMALGAFMAGVLLADSEYRHALETDIEPFKGLLMGLFFMSVGMAVNFNIVRQNPWLLVAMAVGLTAAKIFINVMLGLLFKIPKKQIPFFSVLLSQVGEFAFVLLGAALGFGILRQEESDFLTAVVALTMLLTPFVVLFYDHVYLRIFGKVSVIPDDQFEEEHNPVIIAGFGRFGQIVGRLLYANRIKATVLDHEPGQIEMLRRFGFKVHYGDATRMDLLESAGARNAKILIVAIDNIEDNLKLVDLAQKTFPHLKIFARARNVGHMYSLMDRKVQGIERETFESSLRLGSTILHELGWPAYQSVVAANIFRDHNYDMIKELHQRRDNPDEMISKAKQARDDLEKMFQKENHYLELTDETWGAEQ